MSTSIANFESATAPWPTAQANRLPLSTRAVIRTGGGGGARAPQVRVNRTVRARRGWAKFGDCEGQSAGHKENGVVNIAEKVEIPAEQNPGETPARSDR